MEKTFAIIKPDAVRAGNTEKIIDQLKKNGFAISKMKRITMKQKEAFQLYEIHKGKPFFDEMVSFITSGPLIVMELSRDNAIKAWRTLMGATDPSEATFGTIRKLFGTDIGHNAAHGSDSPENAKAELNIFFPPAL